MVSFERTIDWTGHWLWQGVTKLRVSYLWYDLRPVYTKVKFTSIFYGLSNDPTCVVVAIHSAYLYGRMCFHAIVNYFKICISLATEPKVTQRLYPKPYSDTFRRSLTCLIHLVAIWQRWIQDLPYERYLSLSFSCTKSALTVYYLLISSKYERIAYQNYCRKI